MGKISTQALLQSLKLLQTSEDYWDLKILCGDDTFHVHRAIVCPRSKILEKGDKQNRDWEKDTVSLDDDPKLIRLVINYLYQLEYDDSTQNNELTNGVAKSEVELDSPVARQIGYFESFTEEKPAENNSIQLEAEPYPLTVAEEASPQEFEWVPPPSSKKSKKHKKKLRSSARSLNDDNGMKGHRLTTNTLMYALADKYEIEDLKLLAKSKFADAATTDDFSIDAFVHAAELVFSTTSRTDYGLRKEVINVLDRNRGLLEDKSVQSLLESGNGMAWAMLRVVCCVDP